MGKEISESIVQLRKKALEKKEYLSRLQQLSWRIKKVEELYPLDTQIEVVLKRLISEYDDIYSDFMYIAQLELGCADYVAYEFDNKEVKHEK